MTPLFDSHRPQQAHQAHQGGTDRLAVAVTPTAGGVLVRVRGEIDFDTAGPLKATLLHATVTCDGDRVVLDLSDVSFCDATGLNALLRARLWALGEHRHLTIAAAGRPVTRLLDITGAAALFRDAP
ncbi:STAS domain-containing protein [Streptomyces sp. NPDC058745]|uniref:STAS domain-containing protein n=1 Tax=unclassified Streptomyces TaxID=2593676 RepID=UPI00367C6ED8